MSTTLQPELPRQPLAHGRTVLLMMLGLLALVGPLFVCMPLNSDVALFDVQADRVLRNGVLYRDIIEPNLPGVVWIHVAVRKVLGWSSEAMRFADLLIFGGILLVAWRITTSPSLRESRVTNTSLLFSAIALLFYLSCNEWCHCQRDTWMLLPAMAAVWLRLKRNASVCQNESDRDAGTEQSELTREQTCAALKPVDETDVPARALFARSGLLALLEGVCWGVAFWIKPHIAIPALSVIAVDLLCRRDRRGSVVESAAVIGGGVLAGLPGIAWMVHSGAWPHFWDMMLDWNPEYLKAGRERQSLERWVLMFRRFYPWWLVHLAAIPLAVTQLKNLVAQRSRHSSIERSRLVLSGLYIGWLVQSLALQHAMDYIHVPAMVLGLLIVATHDWQMNVSIRKPVLAAFLLLAMLASPILRPERLSHWTTCLREGSSPALRAKLAHGNFPQWNDLSSVANFLRSQNVADGELTCLNVHSVHLFRELDVQPATRYWCVKILQELFPSRAGKIESAVRESRTRFIVTEANESGVTSNAELPTSYPWDLPVVYEAGTYRVHAVLNSPVAEKARRPAF